MAKLRLLIGLPASGKSTLTRELMQKNGSVVRINRDDLRAMSIPAWSGKREQFIVQSEMAMALQAIRLGFFPIIDDTNLNPKIRDEWKKFCERNSVEYEEVLVKTPVDVCVRQDLGREGRNRVGRAVIENMARKYGMIPWWEYKKLVILDLDGTLCDCEQRRHFVKLPECDECYGKGVLSAIADHPTEKCHKCNGTGKLRRPCPTCQQTGWVMSTGEQPTEKCPTCKGKGTVGKDWKGFYEAIPNDPPVDAVLKWVEALDASGEYTILCVSGRPEDYQHQTVEWLARHRVPYKHLFMRRGGDGREDYIVKREIAETLPLDQIAMVIDDRNQVVKMWRDLKAEKGLDYHVFQVADGNF